MPDTTAWEPQGVCTLFSGFVTAEEYIRSAEDICADARFDDLRVVIKDLSAIEDHAIDGQALDPIAAMRYGARLTNPNIRLILVTTDPRLVPFAYPAPESFMRGLCDSRAFPDMAGARRWLATQPDLANLRATLKL